jgi:L-rhamnose mutarotase
MCLKDTANTLTYRNDSNLIKQYKKLQAIGAVWPEMTAGMKEVGILITWKYISGTNLFMIKDENQQEIPEDGYIIGTKL